MQTNEPQQIAVVIGATGLVGNAVVDQLARADHIKQVVTLTRRALKHASPKVQNYIVDFDCLHRHANLFNADFLFSCLGTTKKVAGSIAAQRKVDLDYQYVAAQLALDQGVKHYLLVSSYGANAQSKNPYLQMKGELESKVIALGFARLSIVRPSLFVGARDERRLGETVASWLLPTLCKLPVLERYKPISGKHVAARLQVQSQQQYNALDYFELNDVFVTD